jgi:hypothetical protein
VAPGLVARGGGKIGGGSGFVAVMGWLALGSTRNEQYVFPIYSKISSESKFATVQNIPYLARKILNKILICRDLNKE